MDSLLFILCIQTFQIPSILSVSTPVTAGASDISLSTSAASTNISYTSSSASSSSPSSALKQQTSTDEKLTFPSESTLMSTSVSSDNNSTSLPSTTTMPITKSSSTSTTSTTTATTVSTTSATTVSTTTATTSTTTATTVSTTITPVVKVELKTSDSPETLLHTTRPGLAENLLSVGNLQQNSSFSQDVTEANTNDTNTDLRNDTNTRESTMEQMTSTQNSTITTTAAQTAVDHSKTTTKGFYNVSDTSVSMSSSIETTGTSSAVSSSATSSSEPSSSNIPTTIPERKSSALTTQKKSPTSTDSSNRDKSPISGDVKCQESAFGTYGLPISVVAFALCVVLFIVILVMMARASRQKRARRMSDDDKSTPKLKMLEIKDDESKRSTNDDLQVYSLDYEKHVQEKIEEHKKKTKPPVAEKPIGGVTSFMLNKKPSVISTVSQPGSPASLSPMSPAEQKPLLKHHDDEPVVFNFAKRPSELLTKRRESAFDEAGRRRSNASTGKSAKSEGLKDKFDAMDV